MDAYVSSRRSQSPWTSLSKVVVKAVSVSSTLVCSELTCIAQVRAQKRACCPTAALCLWLSDCGTGNGAHLPHIIAREFGVEVGCSAKARVVEIERMPAFFQDPHNTAANGTVLIIVSEVR